jgi:pyruvate/2-oxoglutarate dehydrogenase complex dihydrolipoamide dehydrogenase (E3) component
VVFQLNWSQHTGLVGVESAAEIAVAFGSSKTVTLVSSSTNLLPALVPKAQIGAENHLKNVLGVKVIKGEKVTESSGSSWIEVLIYILDSTHYKTDKGTEIEADHVIFAAGPKPNSEFMTKNFSEALNPQKLIMVWIFCSY